MHMLLQAGQGQSCMQHQGANQPQMRSTCHLRCPLDLVHQAHACSRSVSSSALVSTVQPRRSVSWPKVQGFVDHAKSPVHIWLQHLSQPGAVDHFQPVSSCMTWQSMPPLGFMFMASCRRKAQSRHILVNAKLASSLHGLIDCLNQATGQSLINAVGKMAKSSCIDANIMPVSRWKHRSAEECRSMTQALPALKRSKQKVRCPEIVGWLHRKDLPAGALARNNGSSHSLVAKRRSSYQTPEETERTLDMAEHRPSRRLTTAEVQA